MCHFETGRHRCQKGSAKEKEVLEIMVMRKIDVLNNLKGHVLWPQSYHLSEAEAEVCIKALEQEPCNDAINRQTVLDEISDYNNDLDYTTNELYDRVKRMSSVNTQSKTGQWSHDGSHWKNRFICSECGYKLFDEPTNYCPNCGARMVESQESEET